MAENQMEQNKSKNESENRTENSFSKIDGHLNKKWFIIAT
ncbi:637_t:CDS:2 [Diversispora eburnea]|uniref:637_t:CDS:1 n=1 Tax=Diversispora eburnea TaxID=1213867 RepID=A0A9N9AIL0_9GLOM|nr:637_t:CDS:2 [Diversispora eburnea]